MLKITFISKKCVLCVFSTDVDEQQELLGRQVEDAEAGSISAQVFLGKYFLKCSELSNGRGDADSAEQETMAVDWLIKASRQGSEEATDLLKICVERNIGNYTNSILHHLQEVCMLTMTKEVCMLTMTKEVCMLTMTKEVCMLTMTKEVCMLTMAKEVCMLTMAK